jgi:DNA-binding LytR/AlgR family response regulator
MSISEYANGLSIAHHIRDVLNNHSIEIIFITGFAQFMQQAFSVKPIAYLIKPVTEDQLEKELLRLYKELQPKINRPKDYFIIKTNATTYKFIIEEIIYIEYNGSKVEIHTLYCETQVDVSLCTIINQLNCKKFIQCHRSVYVNSDYVTRVDFKSNEIYLNTGHKCYLSRKYKDNWKDT